MVNFIPSLRPYWGFMIGLVAVAGALGVRAEQPRDDKNIRFLENEQVRIGIDLGSGGAICWFSELPGARNLLNHHDRGRLIQQSYYGQEDGSRWVDKPWRWNPVQGGNYLGEPAKLLEVQEQQGGLYVKSIPLHWVTGKLLDECVMEQWIVLSGPLAKVRYRFTYKGTVSHPPRHQELPAVFVDYALNTLAYYQGAAPWTGQALHSEEPGWPNQIRQIPEQWAAYIGQDGRGLGVSFPGTSEITCYRYQGAAGPDGAGCSYFAPIRTMAITPGFVMDYQITLTIGTAAEIRQRFEALRKATPERPERQE